uniref:Uncharacterized protein n=1 Tax=Physcomitrium patens TaxID=3218 RepID=A0A2K1IRE9_PHYPA|nr:hypothetical protein PHYPA_025970 [Physcomitrium patens]
MASQSRFRERFAAAVDLVLASLGLVEEFGLSSRSFGDIPAKFDAWIVENHENLLDEYEHHDSLPRCFGGF